MKNSSESPTTMVTPPTSFSSLPYDIVLNCLARVSITYHPPLSLVSKSFKSILASPELDATRFRIRKTESRLYVCLDLVNNNNPGPCWFILSPIPKQPKLIPIPSFPYLNYPKSSTIFSTGSKIYIIGGFKKKRSKRVFLLDCLSHQWHRLPKLRVRRANPTVFVIDGKIHVTGGCNKHTKSVDWTEIYEQTPLNLTCQTNNINLVEIEKNVLCQISVSQGKILWCNDAKEWSNVSFEVEGLSPTPLSYYFHHIFSVAKSGDGSKVLVWWWKELDYRTVRRSVYTHTRKTEIWCGEISFERRGLEELCAYVTRPEMVITRKDTDSESFLHPAMVNY